MLAFYVNAFILLLKFLAIFLLKVFLFDIIYIKLLVLVLSLIVIYILKTYPRVRLRKLSQLRKRRFKRILKYALHTKISHIWNIFILSTYIGIFFFGFLWLRLLNRNYSTDLSDYYNKFLKSLADLSLTMHIVNILLLICIIIIYIMFLSRISNYAKFHIIKRHLYHASSENYKVYQLKLLNFISKFTMDQPLMFICNRISVIFNHLRKYVYPTYETLSLDEKDNLETTYLFKLEKLLTKYILRVLYKIHYIILIIVIIHDIYYNQYVLTNVFIILPWVFLYDIYIRISRFIQGLWYPFDELIHDFMYKPIIPLTKEEASFGQRLVNLDEFNLITKRYLENNLDSTNCNDLK
jgi:hypothetical protein